MDEKPNVVVTEKTEIIELPEKYELNWAPDSVRVGVDSHGRPSLTGMDPILGREVTFSEIIDHNFKRMRDDGESLEAMRLWQHQCDVIICKMTWQGVSPSWLRTTLETLAFPIFFIRFLWITAKLFWNARHLRAQNRAQRQRSDPEDGVEKA